jgi:hypothetical protein
MPLATDPDQTVDVILPADRDKPTEQQPVFHVQVLTDRQMKHCEQLLSEAVSADGDEALDHLFACYDKLITGWSRLYGLDGQPVQMGRREHQATVSDTDEEGALSESRLKFEPLRDVLTSSELWGLYRHAIQAISAKADDLGNSASPSGSDSE